MATKKLIQVNGKFKIHPYYPVNQVLDLVGMAKLNGKSHIKLDDETLVVNGKISLFKYKGVKCVKCKVVGTRFYLERFNHKDSKSEKYHLNLYALNKHGSEILMTKDHIIPTSKGGPDKMFNYQVLCTACNGEKGNNLTWEMFATFSIEFLKFFYAETFNNVFLYFFYIKRFTREYIKEKVVLLCE